MRKLTYFNGTRATSIVEGEKGIQSITFDGNFEATVSYTNGRIVTITSVYMRFTTDQDTEEQALNSTLDFLNGLNFNEASKTL